MLYIVCKDRKKKANDKEKRGKRDSCYNLIAKEHRKSQPAAFCAKGSGF